MLEALAQLARGNPDALVHALELAAAPGTATRSQQRV